MSIARSNVLPFLPNDRCLRNPSLSKHTRFLQAVSKCCTRSIQPVINTFRSLKNHRYHTLPTSPSCSNESNHIESKTQYKLSNGWQATLNDIRKVRNLRKKLPFEGYPFRRLQINQTGDGLVNAAIAGIGLAALGVNPIIAGVLPFGIRATELIVAAVWNQRMASERREARIAASHNGLNTLPEFSPGLSKKKSAQQILSSTKYDLIAGIATIGAIGLLIAGGPAWGVIGLGVAIAVCQTLSKFKEMAWSALRYVVNENPELRRQQVDLQEPMSAYEMALNVGIMTFSYLVGFGTIFAIYTFAAPAALPVTIAIAVAGAILMVGAKRGFKKEMQEGIEEHKKFEQQQTIQHEQKKIEHEWEKCRAELQMIEDKIQLPINFHTNEKYNWSLVELIDIYKACYPDTPPKVEELNGFVLDQQHAYEQFDVKVLLNKEERLKKRNQIRNEILQYEENILRLKLELQTININT